MNNIEIIDGKKKTSIQAASCYDELTFEQLKEVFYNMPLLNMGVFPETLMLSLLGNYKELLDEISPIQRYAIQETFDFLHQEPKFTKLICNQLVINQKVYHGYKANFFNTTWEEFMYADQAFMKGNYAQAAAVLYRQEIDHYTGETDQRMPFSVYSLPTRTLEFQKLDAVTLGCVAMNYAGLRQTYIVEKYPSIFTTSEKEEKDNKFSWLSVHRNILGEQFFEEDKILKTNLHTVLSRIAKLLKK